MRALVALAALAGCSSVLGIEDLRGLEAGVPPGDGPLPAGTELTGTLGVADVQVNGPLANAALDFTALPDRRPLGNTVTNPNGGYQIILDAAPGPIVGVMQVVGDASGMVLPESHLYPPPIVGNTTFSMTVLGEEGIRQITSLAGMPNDPTTGFVLVLVTDAVSRQPLAGATVKLGANVPVVYAGVGGLPDPMLQTTTEAGLAYAPSVPPTGDFTTVEVTSGTSGSVQARPLTFVTPGSAHYLEVVAD